MARETYFEPIGPITRDIIWAGVTVPVDFRILDGREEKQLAWRAAQQPESVRVQTERELRLALSIVAVNGNPVHFSDDPQEERECRESWVAGFLGPLLYALSTACDSAAQQPLIELAAMGADPNTEPGPSQPGE